MREMKPSVSQLSFVINTLQILATGPETEVEVFRSKASYRFIEMTGILIIHPLTTEPVFPENKISFL